MLKALELVGFKSFADKTRLEFTRGITVVVGPNGSGKSNIVDAIKWVLGEQSVKSLRGKEMADVIFNGSASRRPLNAAESTLTLDNSNRLLAIDAPEVHITRRVYRSGEGEYLINRQPCRLRDIRDLFAGTGVATEAYSVIEQGKVDILLQASARDRRAIFEEAAGISRFKAKKVEAQRRLERVEQNLLRLSDIVEEVENRLKTVRMQAAKARRYKEHADRLQELRTQVGLADWRTLTQKLEEFEAELQSARDEAATCTAQAEAVEARGLALELEIGNFDQTIRSCEAQISQNRERIAAQESTVEHERRHLRELEEEISRHRRQWTSMTVRAGDLEQQLAATTQELAAVELRHREAAGRLAEEERSLTKLTAQLDQIRVENEQHRAAHLEGLRAAAALSSRISGLEATVSSTQSARQRGTARLAELEQLREELGAELSTQHDRLDELTSTTERCRAERSDADGQAIQLRRDLASRQQTLAQLQQRHSGASERAAVLEELEKRLEGVSAGVREVLVKAREASTGPFTQIRGLVADLLQVNIETAPLVEIALGDLAQHLVVASSRELVSHLEQHAGQLAGRVGFIRLDVLPPLTGVEQTDLQNQPGIVGRADRLVESAPEFAVLAKRLLGKIWVVESLTHALALQAGAGRGLGFVTLAGEHLSADGTLSVGPRRTATGLISRRSELRSLRTQIADMATKIEREQQQRDELQTQLAAVEQRLATLADEFEQLSEALSAQQLIVAAGEERRTQLANQQRSIEAELKATTDDHQTALAALADARARLAQTEEFVSDVEKQHSRATSRAAELEQARQRHARETNGCKVELAKSEQQLEGLRAQQSQLQRDQQERGRALAENRSQLAECLRRARETERTILHCEAEIAELYLRKEVVAAQTVRHLQGRDTYRADKAQLAQEAQRSRNRIRKLETKIHAKELSANEVRHERTVLADRLREDYGIELAELEHLPTPDELQERAAVDQEISELRSKINSIGGVNLDALEELDELEQRFVLLSSQHADLSTAKNSLEQIIGKINADSRRLFADTLQVVREHFQALFRKLFGGGQADIVLEEGVDILDSGIEIVARPPGKEPRSISLLSGGEKTLTCVALLLAIFRSRPSPFCVLDEVDAALDEANIERFIAVLKEFLAWTQFIVVTHSKKTMTCASTLYGVTMQESGISKRVSVRFDDVSDTGEILNFTESDETTTGKDEIQAT